MSSGLRVSDNVVKLICFYSTNWNKYIFFYFFHVPNHAEVMLPLGVHDARHTGTRYHITHFSAYQVALVDNQGQDFYSLSRPQWLIRYTLALFLGSGHV